MKLRLRLVTLAAVLLFCFSALAVNHFPVGYAYHYYSGPDYQTMVGSYVRECEGWIWFWGTTSEYRVYEEWPCPH